MFTFITLDISVSRIYKNRAKKILMPLCEVKVMWCIELPVSELLNVSQNLCTCCTACLKDEGGGGGVQQFLQNGYISVAFQ
jgi:hypothetical protein